MQARTVPQRSLPRLQPTSGSPEVGHWVDWPKSETSDFGWRDRVGASGKIRAMRSPSPPLRQRKSGLPDLRKISRDPGNPGARRGRERTELAARADSISAK